MTYEVSSGVYIPPKRLNLEVCHMLEFIYGGVLQVGGNPNSPRIIQTTNELAVGN